MTESRHPVAQRMILRTATSADAPLLTRLAFELAESTNQTEQISASAWEMKRYGGAEELPFRALIAECDGQTVGYALFFDYYSTWHGPGFYLEDLYVRPNFRRRGIARALLGRVAAIAESDKRNFIRWAVLHCNQPALNLYRSSGASILEEWQLCCLPGSSLKLLAEQDSLRRQPTQR